MRIPILALALSLLLASSAVATPTIFLVRHAEKARWFNAVKKDPRLSGQGRQRAQALAAVLHDAGVTAIYVTEFQRTQQTAAPLAHALGLRPKILPAKATPALIARLKKTTGHVLVVGHSNTIPDILKALGVSTAITIKETDYDNLFVLFRGRSAPLLRLHYR